MNKIFVKPFPPAAALLCLCAFCASACGQKEDLLSLYAQTLLPNTLSETQKLKNLTLAAEYSNTYIAQDAALSSLSFSADEKTLKRAEKYALKFPSNEKIVTRYAQLLFENGKYSEVVSLAQSSSRYPDFKDSGIRCLAVQSAASLEDNSFIEQVLYWFTKYSIDESHTAFSKTALFEMLPPYVKFLCRLRIYVYERDYGKAYRNAKELIAFCSENNETLLYERFVLSDIGKAFLYGWNDYEKSAVYFEDTGKVSRGVMENYVSYFAYFYAGRLYEKALKPEKALEMYELAFTGAQGEDYDNALWYYLSLMEKSSIQKTLQTIQKTAPLWHDPLYYNDLLEKISVRLLTEKKWMEYYRLYEMLSSYADSESLARISYICARLVELGFIPPSSLKQEGTEANTETVRDSFVKELYEKAFYGSHSSLYYRVLSAERLNIPIEDPEDSLFYRKETGNFLADEDACEALLFYAENGLFSECYELYSAHAENVPLETVSMIASLAASSGTSDPSLYPLSIRMMYTAVSSVDAPLTVTMLKNLYPRFYEESIQNACDSYGLSGYLMYALVRSESLFDKNVVSSAGAVGLCQLMKPTAGDIARKLSITEYDLKDERINTEFGAFYLKELIRRLDGSVMKALFSYNAGITRVREWQGSDRSLPVDLFLETLPYDETRTYGRKILSAAAFYGYLYYGVSTHGIVQAIMN